MRIEKKTELITAKQCSLNIAFTECVFFPILLFYVWLHFIMAIDCRIILYWLFCIYIIYVTAYIAMRKNDMIRSADELNHNLAASHAHIFALSCSFGSAILALIQ